MFRTSVNTKPEAPILTGGEISEDFQADAGLSPRQILERFVQPDPRDVKYGSDDENDNDDDDPTPLHLLDLHDYSEIAKQHNEQVMNLYKQEQAELKKRMQEFEDWKNNPPAPPTPQPADDPAQ